MSADNRSRNLNRVANLVITALSITAVVLAVYVSILAAVPAALLLIASIFFFAARI